MPKVKVTDEELQTEIEKFLKDADLSKTSSNKVLKVLEQIFDTDLSSKKSVIEKKVMDYVNSQPFDDEEEDEDDDEEEDEKPAKGGNKRAKKAASDDDFGSEEEEKEKPAKGNKRAKKPASDDDDFSEDEEVKKPAKRAAKNNKRAKKTRKNSDDDDDSNDSEYEDKKAKPKKAAGKKKGAGGKGGGYTKPVRLSPALAELMGETSMPRHEVVRRVWALIKEKQLYDPSNKQFAICDDALYKVIGTKRFRTFGMMKYLKTHFINE